MIEGLTFDYINIKKKYFMFDLIFYVNLYDTNNLKGEQ